MREQGQRLPTLPPAHWAAPESRALDTPFFPARLEARWEEATDLVGLRFVPVSPALTASFTIPGQYTAMRLGDAGTVQAYFALASQPGATPFEYLVKRVPTPAASALMALEADATVQISTAQGPGYPVAGHMGKDVLLVAVGSGISSIRSLATWLATHRAQYGTITLFHGGRSHNHLAYQADEAAWEAANIRVQRVLSHQDAHPPRYFHGYIQDALAQHDLAPAQTVAFVCGMKEMVQAVSAVLVGKGMSPDAIFQNH